MFLMSGCRWALAAAEHLVAPLDSESQHLFTSRRNICVIRARWRFQEVQKSFGIHVPLEEAQLDDVNRIPLNIFRLLGTQVLRARGGIKRG